MRLRRAVIAAAAVCMALAPSAAARSHPIGGFIRDLSGGTAVHATRAVASAHAASLANSDGGPVLHSNRTHVIFWQPSGSGLTFDPGYETTIERFLTDVAADSHKPTNVYGLSGQYRDDTGPAAYNSSYGGAVLDTDQLPPNGCVEPPVSGPGWVVCVNDGQLQAEIEHVISVDHLPTSWGNVYFLVTPNGLGSCIDSTSQTCALGGSGSGYCGYHSETASSILYAVIPYNAVSGHCQSSNPRPNDSTADPAISTISHEHNEMVTDPEGDAWTDGQGNEDGDLCITSFGPPIGGAGASAWNESIHGGHYYLQEEWSNDDGGCAPRDESDSVSIAGPRRTVTGRAVFLTAHAGDPDGAIVAYTWSFGDGHTGHRRVPKHTYRRPGVYKVVLQVTDRAGNWAFTTRTIHVARRHRQ